MTDQDAHRIADAYLTFDAATKQLAESERLGQTMKARDNRRAVAAAQGELDEAVATAKEA